MWQKRMKKTVFTLNIDNYHPEIIDLTYPLIKHYAHKIDADFYTITERKFPNFPPTYEKLQIYELAQQMENDWNIYFDSDAVIHPELIDLTTYIPKDTVAHNGNDFASLRWRYDRYFSRDGRNIGSCNWCTIASDWCIELWEPPQDLTYEEIMDRIYPAVVELNTVITPDHLIDDFILSRNIAKYGLKFTTLVDLFKKIGFVDPKTGDLTCAFFWHEYTVPMEEKIINIKRIMEQWRIIK